MDAELKTKWLEALRSGEYEQANRSLRRVDAAGGCSYCCLGVLCDVVNPKGWEDSTSPVWINSEMPEGDNIEAAWLSSAMCESIKLNTTTMHMLVSMNDDGKPFSVIADFIEKNA